MKAIFLATLCLALSTRALTAMDIPNVLIGGPGLGNGKFEFRVSGMAVSPEGLLLACDETTARVQVFSTDGRFLRRWGHLGDQLGDLKTPEKVQVTKEGTVFVEDRGRHLMMKYDLSGKPLESWPLPPDATVIGFDPDGTSYLFTFGKKMDELEVIGPDGKSKGTLGSGLLYWPEYVEGDGKGSLYISDRGPDRAHPRFRICRLDGGTKLVWQMPFPPGFDKEMAFSVSALHLDGKGNLFALGAGSDKVDKNGKKVGEGTGLRLWKFSLDGKPLKNWKLKPLESSLYSFCEDFALLGQDRAAFRGGNLMALVSLDHLDQPLTHLERSDPLVSPEAAAPATGWEFEKQIGENLHLPRVKARKPAHRSRFSHPLGLALDEKGFLYVTGSYKGRIYVFDPEGNLLRDFGEQETQNWRPALAVRGNHIYVANGSARKVEIFSTKGQLLKSWKVDFTEEIKGLALDGEGNVYVTGGPWVCKYAPGGKLLMKFGGHGQGSGDFYSANGIALDPRGKIYVTDDNRNALKIFDAKGKFLQAWEAEGNGPGELDHPTAVALDREGRVFVANDGVSRNPPVQVFDPSGKYLGAIGVRGEPYDATYGTIAGAKGITVDPRGRVFVVDSANSRIQVFSPKGKKAQAAAPASQPVPVSQPLLKIKKKKKIHFVTQ